MEWIDREPGLPAALHELTRVLRRGRRRWVITMLVAAGITGLLIAKLSRKPSLYKARAILTMTEGAFADTRRSLRRGELEGYLWNVALSKKKLYPIIAELELYPDMRLMGESEAVTALRADLDLTVFGNFFLLAGTEGRRTVRIALTYTGLDAAVVVKVVERLATAVIDHERERQNRVTGILEQQALLVLEEAKALVERKELRMAEIASRLPASEERERSLLEVENVRLQMDLQTSGVALTQARNDLTAAKVLRASPLAIELSQLRTPKGVNEKTRRLRLVLAGAFAFIALLLMTAIFIGAFDTRVRNAEDIERIGLPVVGHIPSFRGDRSGSLLHRLPKRRFWQRRRLSGPGRRA